MITDKELATMGWTNSLDNSEEYYRNNRTITLTEGKIIFITEWDNFHGLNLNIKTISEFKLFLNFIPS